jgi:hypothetical protein
MKIFNHPWIRGARVLTVLCAGMFWSSTVPAQPVMNTVDSRFLFVFDTSSAMKSRVPKVQYAVERLFLSMMNGQLRSENDIGVWTFNRELHTGELPVQRWLPQNAATISATITNFVAHQRYSKSTRFDTIMPAINSVVRNSQRLTVLIFCDGSGQISGTPYDEAINSSFKQNQDSLATAKESFIVVLRAQSGQYTGYSINSSAIGVNFPEFPPLPAPPQPAAQPPTNQPPPAAPVPAPEPPPVVKLTPLVIIGTNVGSNMLPPIPARAVLSNSSPAKVEPGVPPGQPASSRTNTVLSKLAGGSTNAVASASPDSGLSRRGAMTTGVILLTVAALTVILGLIRSRRPRGGSLITKAMNKR